MATPLKLRDFVTLITDIKPHPSVTLLDFLKSMRGLLAPARELKAKREFVAEKIKILESSLRERGSTEAPASPPSSSHKNTKRVEGITAADLLRCVSLAAAEPATVSEVEAVEGDYKFPFLTAMIEELERHVAAGALENKYRYFGVDGWSNWGVEGFLECGCAGAFGYFEVGDGQGEDIVEVIEWEKVENFLDCGAHYE